MTFGSTRTRVLDAGGPWFLHEKPPYDPMPACGRGVCVEMPAAFGTADPPFVVSLRLFERHDGGPATVEPTRFDVAVSLATGACSPDGANAERALLEHPWIAEALASQIEPLRQRARRLSAQRDRSSVRAALQRAEPGMMVHYDQLFPHDWDLIFVHDGQRYWASDQHCPNPACTCREILVTLHDLSCPAAPSVGNVRINPQSRKPRPDASSTEAVALFESLWARFGPELTRRHHEVRRAVLDSPVPRSQAAAPLTPARNAPCPCGSGKKFKRCCASKPRTDIRPIGAAR
jgi:SEC-C motif